MDTWGVDQCRPEGDDVGRRQRQFPKALGLELDLTGRGMGMRSQRYAMIVEDGTVTGLMVEAAGAFDVSSAENILATCKIATTR